MNAIWGDSFDFFIWISICSHFIAFKLQIHHNSTGKIEHCVETATFFGKWTLVLDLHTIKTKLRFYYYYTIGDERCLICMSSDAVKSNVGYRKWDIWFWWSMMIFFFFFWKIKKIMQIHQKPHKPFFLFFFFSSSIQILLRILFDWGKVSTARFDMQINKIMHQAISVNNSCLNLKCLFSFSFMY